MRRYTISVNDNPYVIDVEEVTADNYLVTLDGRRIDVRLDDHADLGQAMITPQVEVRGTPSTLPPWTPAPLRPAPAATRPTAGSDAATLSAPMPGVVLSVEVAVGARVSRGDALVVLEAMKMKNALRAPRDAVVAAVLVKDGDQVAYGAPLVRFEA